MTESAGKIKNILTGTNLLDNAEFDFNLSGIASLGAGGRCACFLKVERRSDLAMLVSQIAPDSSIKCYPVGECTNILFNEGYLDILVIRLGGDFNYFNCGKNGEISAGASLNLQKFLVLAAMHGYDFSFLAGIPGTVGGAVIGNSGTQVQGIDQMVSRVRYIYRDSKKVEEKEININSSNYSYRFFDVGGLFLLTDIVFKKNTDHPVKMTAAGAEKDRALKLPVKDGILEKIRKNIKIKKRNQPLGLKSAGCFFKNPAGIAKSAAEIIDCCGFKGFRFGDAIVSEKHANFIINSGSAMSRDIHTLSEIVRDHVMKKYKIDLKYEVRLVGF